MIINGFFNCLFSFLWVISVHYCILDSLFHLYPTSTLWCVSFALFPPFHSQNSQLTFRFLGNYFYHFTLDLPAPLYFSSRFFFVLTARFGHLFISNMIFLRGKNHTISFSFLPIISLFFPPLKIFCERSDIPSSQTSNPTTQGFCAFCSPSCPNFP